MSAGPPDVVVPLAAGFEEIEAVTVIDVLRRASVRVVVAGVDGPGPVTGSRGIVVVPDRAWADADGDAGWIVLPGGKGGAERLAEHPGVQAALAARSADGRPVAAICAAPFALDAAGLLQDAGFTCYPGWEARIRASGRRDEPVVDAGFVVTSQGPGTAMGFALHLVGRIRGASVRAEVAAGLLVPGLAR